MSNMKASTSSSSFQGERPYTPSQDEKEKTIPFLRQLTEMLQNNEELILFVPGQRLPHETIHGKIIVHDRNRVQAEVLPVYFNHASFASLRRQLSYFSFVRVGKSRQSGVTYTNDLVVDLSDIRRLKRRSVGQAGAAAKTVVQHQEAAKQRSFTKQRILNDGGLIKNKVQQPRPQLPMVLKQHQKQQQQLKPEGQQQQQQVTTTSADVASAILSGTVHAAKTNDNLDTSNTIHTSNINGVGQSSTARTSPISHTVTNSSANTQSQSSISQSISQGTSSSNSSDNRDNNCPNSLKLSHKIPKKKVKKQHSIPHKDRARFDRLLSVNNIVPFIHLPVGYTMASKKRRQKEESMMNMGSGSSNSNESNTHAGARIQQQKENKSKQGRERATSDGAINALLALGSADRQ